VQGLGAAAGLGVVIVRIEPLFLAIKWAGVAYLTVLGAQAVRSAIRGRYADPASGRAGDVEARAFRGWRQGFLSNITNPKVLVFYLAVLPQFLGPHAAMYALVLFALSHAVLSGARLAAEQA
jgi:threonine/homoserine/homoserine lactone efflux protein